MNRVVVSVVTALAALSLVASGCGARSGANDRVQPKPAGTAPRDNGALAPAALRDRAVSELDAVGSYRVHLIRRDGYGRTDLRIDVTGNDALLVGTYRGFPIQALALQYEVFIRSPRFPNLTDKEQDVLQGRLHGRWVSFFADDMKATGIPRLMVDVGGSLAAGRRKPGRPTDGDDRVVGGIATVSYRLPDRTVVRIPRTGTPLPVVVEMPNGSVTYSDFGEPITVERPEPSQMIWFGDLPEGSFG